jgi:hypothetical protein
VATITQKRGEINKSITQKKLPKTNKKSQNRDLASLGLLLPVFMFFNINQELFMYPSTSLSKKKTPIFSLSPLWYNTTNHHYHLHDIHH